MRRSARARRSPCPLVSTTGEPSPVTATHRLSRLLTRAPAENSPQNQPLSGIQTKTGLIACHNAAEMRTCTKSRPPTPAPKAQHNPDFCQRTQAAPHQKNTDPAPGFPGFPTPLSRVPRPHPGISQLKRAQTLPEIQTTPRVENPQVKNAKRTEPKGLYPFLSVLIRGQKVLSRLTQPTPTGENQL